MTKSQDVVTLLWLSLWDEWTESYAALGKHVGLSTSAVHDSIQRCRFAGLVAHRSLSVIRMPTTEFVVSGVPFCFPARLGALSRGVPTGYGAPPLRMISDFVFPEGSIPVWPSATGTIRGPQVEPLYRTVPNVALADDRFYALLATLDALRVGRGREREAAKRDLHRLLNSPQPFSQ
jgi:hypothetical protein